MTFIAYLFRKFVPVFLGAVAFFVMVLELIDVFTNLWRYMAENVAFGQVARVMLLYVPKAVSFSIPLSILFAVSYVISDLYAKNELTAIFSSGVSLFSFVWPLLLFALMVSAALFFFEDRIVVPSYQRKTELQRELLKEQSSYSNNRVVVLSDGGKTVYKADFYDDYNQRLYGLYVVFRTDGGVLDGVLRAASALWREGEWVLSEPYFYAWNGETLDLTPVPVNLALSEGPETFRNIVISVEEVNAAQARSYIGYLRRAGLPYMEAQVQYYRKFSFPFIVFIVVFLSVGLSGKTRKNVLLVSLVLSISSAVLYYVTQMVMGLLARFGYISPLAGAWFPVFIFVVLSIFLLRISRT